MIRRITAPAPPMMIARRRFSGDSRLAAIPMTTALSPDKIRSKAMILPIATSAPKSTKPDPIRYVEVAGRRYHWLG